MPQSVPLQHLFGMAGITQKIALPSAKQSGRINVKKAFLGSYTTAIQCW